jgi:hypothetical protein
MVGRSARRTTTNSFRNSKKYAACHEAINIYCRRDCKTRSISQTNFCHSFIALIKARDIAVFDVNSELGRRMRICASLNRASNGRKRRHPWFGSCGRLGSFPPAPAYDYERREEA